MRVSAVIPCYKRPDTLRKTLLSLCAQSYVVDETVVTDDGSGDEILLMLRELAPSLKFPVKYVNHADLGFRASKTRNNGIRVATGDFLVFSDHDLVFTKNYVKTFVDNARRGEFLVSWPVRLTREQTELVTDEMILSASVGSVVTPEQWESVGKQRRKDLFYRLLHRLGLRPIGPKLRSGVFAAFREDLVAVNGFDEAYKGWGNEDDDLGWRLHRFGVKGRNATTSEVAIHLWHPANDGAARANLAYYRKRIAEIKKGDYLCRYGINNPLDSDPPSEPVLLEGGKGATSP